MRSALCVARRPALVMLLVAASTGLVFSQAPQQRAPQPPGFPRVPPFPPPSSPQTLETLTGSIRVVPLATGLANPWSLAFLPDGSMLVTERPGRLRIVRNGVLDPTPVSGVPEVRAVGQGGLLEVALHPRFAENRFIYLTYAKPGERGGATALARGRLEGNTLQDVRDLFVADNWSQARAHFGSKLAFDREGMLFMTVGERTERDGAQDLGTHRGKILRLREDGTPAPGNPFLGKAGARPEIYSYGHRNPQGLAIHPDTGEVWAVEHGPQGGDELNVIRPGRNYGWPVISFGREYTGEIISETPARDGMEQPLMFWVPSIGISGLTFYTGDRFPQWKGNVFVGGLSGLVLQRLVFTEKGPIGREALLGTLKQRIRDVRQGPDGLLYAVTDGDPGTILRIEPVSATTTSAAGAR